MDLAVVQHLGRLPHDPITLREIIKRCAAPADEDSGLAVDAVGVRHGRRGGEGTHEVRL